MNIQPISINEYDVFKCSSKNDANSDMKNLNKPSTNALAEYILVLISGFEKLFKYLFVKE